MLVHPPVSHSFPPSPHATKPSTQPTSGGHVVRFPDPDVLGRAGASAPPVAKLDIDKLLTSARPLIPHPIAFQPAQKEANAKPRHTFPPLTSTPTLSSSSASPSSSSPSAAKPHTPQANGTHSNGHARPHPSPTSSPKPSTSSPTPPLSLDDSTLPPPAFTLFPPSSLPALSHFPPSITRPGVGLHNLGNSCFLNSTLQALIHTPLLASYCLSRAHSKRCTIKSNLPTHSSPSPPPPTLAFGSRDWHPPSLSTPPPSLLPPFCLFCAVEDLIVRSLTGSPQPFSPNAIFNRLPSISRSLRRGRQEDAHEFLRMALDGLQGQALAMDLPQPPPTVKGPSGVGGRGGGGAVGVLPKGSLVPAALFASLQPAQLHRVKETSVLYAVYAGYYRSTLTCKQCKRPSHTFEPFLDLSLSIPRPAHSAPSFSAYSSSSYTSQPYSSSFSRFPSFGHNHWQQPRPPAPPSPPLTLQHCLSLFTSDEHLDASNLYRCPSCKCCTKASKRLTIHRPPNVLVVHLKRFEHGGGGGGGGEKIMRMVTYEKELDLRPYMSEKEGGVGEVGYELYAVLVHQGSTMMSGHYYSYVKAANGRWYQMNDEMVREADVREVLQQKAYMLFYSKKKVEGEETAPAVVVKEVRKEAAHSNGNGKAKEEGVVKPKVQVNRFKQLVADLQEEESKEAPRTPAVKVVNEVQPSIGSKQTAASSHDDDDDDSVEDEQKERKEQPSEKKSVVMAVERRVQVVEQKAEVVEEKAARITLILPLPAPPPPAVLSPSKPLTLAAVGALSPMSSPPPSPQSAAKKRKSFVVTSSPSSSVAPTMPSFQRGSMQKFNAFAGSGKRMKRGDGAGMIKMVKLVDYSSSSSSDEDEAQQSQRVVTNGAHSSEAPAVEEKAGDVEGRSESKEEMKEERKEEHTVESKEEMAVQSEAGDSAPPAPVPSVSHHRPSSPPSPSPRAKRALEEKEPSENEERRKRRLILESRLTSTTSVAPSTLSGPAAEHSVSTPSNAATAESATIRFDPHAHRHSAHSQFSTVIPTWDEDVSHEQERATAMRQLEAERRPKEKDEYDREYDRGRERKVRGKREELPGAAVSGRQSLLQRELEERTGRKREEEQGGGRHPSRGGDRDRRGEHHSRSSRGDEGRKGGDGRHHSHRSHSSRHHSKSSHYRSRHSHGSGRAEGKEERERERSSRGHLHRDDRRHSDSSHHHRSHHHHQAERSERS